MRQEITLHNVALDALDAAGQLGESRDGLFDALEFVIVEAERRHDNGGEVALGANQWTGKADSEG